MNLLRVSTEKLLLIAGIVWILAGINIANIGIGAYLGETGWVFWVSLLGTLIIFLCFHIVIFTKMVRKHDVRIRGYEDEKTPVWKFFDTKGYLIMAFMMGGGIALRMSGWVPEWFIAFFYTGLGVALAVAGISFLIRYFKKRPGECPAVPRKTDKE